MHWVMCSVLIPQAPLGIPPCAENAYRKKYMQSYKHLVEHHAMSSAQAIHNQAPLQAVSHPTLTRYQDLGGLWHLSRTQGH